ncbi:WD40 repeat-like protein [Rhizoclosmatium globosum]|uniref:WD40 repeat-like protein n=1 Tax=Rhizoclosmatium globosum TaxID=329046 RepID=A0A1Y2BS60_9FUNG|nr:WD40 repeat-like protein [Rhizoclosmatium globosum]|eukprot:ORY37586.1 WD40 repeat-like protein [Rhizoclosmatium globosum]
MQSYASVAAQNTHASNSSLSTALSAFDDDGGRHGFRSSEALNVNEATGPSGPSSVALAPATTTSTTTTTLTTTTSTSNSTSTSTSKRTLRCRMQSPLSVLSASPDYSKVLVGGKDVLKILRISDADVKEWLNLRAGLKTQLNYSLTDAKWAPPFAEATIASAYLNGDILIWDLNRGSQKQAFSLKDHDQSVNRLSFSPIERVLLLSACQDATVKLWDLRDKSGPSTTFEGRADKVRDVQFSPTSPYEFIAAFENGDVQKWDLRKPSEPERRWSAHFGLALTIDWHPDGSVFASAGRDKVIKFWDTKAEGRKPFQTIQTSSHVARIAWRPSSNGIPAHQIASCSLAVDSKLTVWDLGRGFVAEWAVEEHDDPITDFLWTDADVVWTVSKDHMFVRQDLHVAGYHPSALLSPCAADWNQYGDLTFSIPHKVTTFHPPTHPPSSLKTKHPSATNIHSAPINTGSLPAIAVRTSSSSAQSTASPLNQIPTIPSPHPGPIAQLSAIYETESFNHVSFIQLAYTYKTTTSPHPTPSEIWDLCMHNSEAASNLDLPRASQTWKFLGLLFGTDTPAPTTSTNPALFKKASTALPHSQKTTPSQQYTHTPPPEFTTDPFPEEDLDDEPDILDSDTDSDDDDEDVRFNQAALKASKRGISVTTAGQYTGAAWFKRTPFTTTGEHGFEDSSDDEAITNAGSSLASTTAGGGRLMVGLANWNPRSTVTIPGVIHTSEVASIDSTNHHVSGGVETAVAAVAAQEPKWVFEGIAVPQLDHEKLAKDVLEFYGELGNAQMCCTILMVLRGALGGAKIDARVKEVWVSSYVDLLHRFKLWTPASHILSHCSIPSIQSRTQESTTFHTACGFCSKPIPNAPQPGWVCERCLAVTSTCGLCHGPVKGAFTWCFGCQHGGHLQCMAKWFERNRECCCGCGHVCVFT